MKNLPIHHKSAILHCAYQIIASADGGIDEERDGDAIDLLLTELGFSSVYAWDAAIRLNPHDSFFHVSTLNDNDKENFRQIMLRVAQMAGNNALRNVCAQSVFELCNV